VIAVASIVVVAVISLLITRVATMAFVLTGMSVEAARFQARSALTGTGSPPASPRRSSTIRCGDGSSWRSCSSAAPAS